MKKATVIFLGLAVSVVIFHFAFAKVVLAHCPLCVAGAAAGLTLSRLLGIDDSITGLWIGAFLGAVSFWSEGYIFRLLRIKSQILKSAMRPVLFMLIVFLTLISFYQFNLVNRMSQLFGLDKLTYGIIAGSIIFYAVDLVDDYLINKNGRVFFPYQRIAVSLGTIVLSSFIQYYLINYVI